MPGKSSSGYHFGSAPPFATKSAIVFAEVIGWGAGETPQAPAGFTVTKYAEGFDNPRITRLTPTGQVLVVESNINFSPLVQAGAVITGAAKSHSVFEEGQPAGKPEVFLSGFIADAKAKKVRGRPVGLMQMPDGSILLTDDTSNTIWRIAFTG